MIEEAEPGQLVWPKIQTGGKVVKLPILFVSFIDIAPEGIASQPSTWNDDEQLSASKTIDGDRTTFSHSKYAGGQYIVLEFKKTFKVYEISITNRLDSNQFRLSDFTIYIGPSLESLNICVANQDMSNKRDEDFKCKNGPMVGKYFKIVLHSNNYLHIAEIVMNAVFV